MTSRRTERLVNLTMALLATRRYLTKSEIFRSVEGYEGNDESKERMFERDKDALRTLGIVINVRGIDPTFEDEPGYRILPDTYALNFSDLSGSDVALLSLAAEAWRGAALNESAQSALLKLKSMGIESDYDLIPMLSPRLGVVSENFQPLTRAIMERRAVSFDYLADDLSTTSRAINPFGLGSRKGNWYLVGFDLTRNAPRTFRLDRIQGSVVQDAKRDSFQADSDFDVLAFLDSNHFDRGNFAEILIRRSKGWTLRRDSELLGDDDEFQRMKVSYINRERFVDEILWHGEDVVVLGPQDLQEEVIAKLTNLVESHG
ncbi:MAG: WYL domain-containing protein [Actinobacteria bacterium]|nr:WYL domain-containing protein [Actinomycetota bacterium]